MQNETWVESDGNEYKCEAASKILNEAHLDAIGSRLCFPDPAAGWRTKTSAAM